MRALGLGVLGVFLVAGCSSPPPSSCDGTNCTGCCTSAGMCVSGQANDFCGSGGAACDVCVAGQTCGAGKCGGASGGGAGGGTGGGSGGGTGGGSAKMGGFPDLAGGSNGRQPMLMIDAAGTRHLLYGQLTGGTGTNVPVRYGECSNNCAVGSSWQFATIGDKGTLGEYAKLALTAQGKPRAVWSRTPSVNDPDTLYFGSCDSNCTSAAGWTSGPIRTLGAGEYLSAKLGRNLAVDGTGKVHLVYSAKGLFYTACAGNCTQPGSWSAPVKLSSSTGKASLAADATGKLKLAATLLDDLTLMYRSCDANCDQPAGWSAQLNLWASIEGLVSLRVDAQGRPRIFFNENGAGSPARHLTLYSFCDSNCTAMAGWQTFTVGLEPSDGKEGLDFDLHGNGAISAAYQSADSKLSVVTCPSNCQSLSASWSRDPREDGDAVTADMSPPLPAVCATLMPPKQGYAYWYPGEHASAAVNPVTQKLEVVHRTYTLEKCGSAGNVSEGVTIPRYSGPF
jgi:hypothetical protein